MLGARRPGLVLQLRQHKAKTPALVHASMGGVIRHSKRESVLLSGVSDCKACYLSNRLSPVLSTSNTNIGICVLD